MKLEPLKTSVSKEDCDKKGSMINILNLNAKGNENLRQRNESFIKKAIVIHGNKYDYSKTVYTLSKEKVLIICPTHGEFWQKANGHLNGKGCRACAGNNYPSTTEEFILKSHKIHGDKYSYREVVYKNRHFPINITCYHHGIFLQSPSSHLNGRGCPRCGGSLIYDTKSFVDASIKLYGNKYNYSYVNYKNEHERIVIICPKHGQFNQRPNNHINGHGCHKCGIENRKCNNGFKWKTYVFLDGRKVNVQGYEPQTISLLLSSSIAPENICLNKDDKPIIYYNWNGKLHMYFPDCYIPTSNTIVETKSLWYWNKDIEQNIAKINGSLSQGYNIRFVIWNKSQLIKDVTYF